MPHRQHEVEKVKGESVLGTAQIIFTYLLNDIEKKPRSFKIGIFTIFLVIGFLAAIQSAFQLSPVIFLAIAEDQIGDSDIIMTQSNSVTMVKTKHMEMVEASQESNSTNLPRRGALSQARLLNFTALEPTCESTPGIQGCSPRWMLLGYLYNKLHKQKFHSYVIALDTVNERSVGIGRRFDEDLLNEGEAYVTATTVRGLQLQEGQNITLNLDIISALINNGNVLSTNLPNNTYEGIQSWIASQLRTVLINRYPQLMRDGLEVNLSKQQIVQITERLQKLAGSTDNFVGRQAFYIAMQTYLDTQNIPINARESMSVFVENGNLIKISNSFHDIAVNLPNTYTVNVTSASNELSPLIMRGLNITIDFVIKKSVNNPKGKWPSSLGNSIVIDSKFMLQTLWNGVSKEMEKAMNDPEVQLQNPTILIWKQAYYQFQLQNQIHKDLAAVRVNDYAMTCNGVFSNRVEIYSSKEDMQQGIVKISNAFSENNVKNTPTQSTLPLSIAVKGLLVLKMFLDNLIATSIFLLVMLAILLIYSLMISDVEEKTYEFGMLRALGFNKSSLIYLILVEGVVFAIPGLFLGLLMAYVLNTFIAYYIFDQSMLVTSYNLHSSALTMALMLGILIPLLSVYLPIQRAMSKTLRDSLDLYHRVVNEISVSVQKLESLGVSFAQSFNSCILILMGISCYYFAPLAFMNQNIQLFLTIINFILILMIVGFTLLLNLFQPLVERVFVKMFLIFLPKARHLESVIVKNMAGHRRRNSKTALMYTVALSFLIFAGTGFNLQSKSIEDNMKSSLGSDIKVILIKDLTGLNEAAMREFLLQYNLDFPGQIQDFSFTSLPIDKFPKLSKPHFSSLSQFPTNRYLQLRGVEKNYLRSVYLDYYYPTELDPTIQFPYIQLADGQYSQHIDTIAGLFSDEGLQELNNNLDFFGLSSNSRLRDQNQITIDEDKPKTDNQNDNSPTIDAKLPIYRDKYDDQEIKLIIPSGLHYVSSIDVSTPCLLNFDNVKYRSRVRATATKLPGFRFSSYRQIAYVGEMVTGMEQFRYLLDTLYYYKGLSKDKEVIDFFNKVKPNSTYGIPKSYLTVQFARELTLTEREAIGNGLRNFFESDLTQLFDVPALTKSINDTLFFIDLFSLVVAGIAITLSFFLILVSFVANIKENSWEFGVLRAIGLSKVQITQVYMIESCALVLASGFIGTVIGITVAVTLTLQLLMFTELPFTFVFPYGMFFTTFFSGLFIAATGSYSALADFKDKPIAAIVKGLI